MVKSPDARQIAEQISAEVLSNLSDVIRRELGIYLPMDRWGDLKRALAVVCQRAPGQCLEDLVNSLVSSKPDVGQLRTLSHHLTIGETYFFRDDGLFDALRQKILPPLIQRAQKLSDPIRIWSAGCSTGEEPYSVAMLLHELGARVQDSYILATDLNENSLQAAHDAVYGEWSFRGCLPEIKSRHFRHIGKRYVLAAPIRQRVTFQKLNLVKDEKPCTGGHAFDIVLCRNVLMYFERNAAQQQVEHFFGCLKEDGWLALAASEVAHLQLDKFRHVRFSGVLLHQKPSKLHSLSIIPEAPEPASPVHQRRLSKATPPAPPQNSRNTVKSGTAFPKKIKAPDIALEAATVSFSSELTHLQRLSDNADYHQLLRDALPLIDKNMPPDAKSDCFVLAARAAANIGKPDRAVEWCKLAQKAAPQNVTAYHLAGVLFLATGLLDEAMAEFRRALYIKPDHIGCQIAYARLLKLAGNSSGSRKHLQSAFSALDNAPPEQVVPDMDGMTAGDVAGVVLQMLKSLGDM